MYEAGELEKRLCNDGETQYRLCTTDPDYKAKMAKLGLPESFFTDTPEVAPESDDGEIWHSIEDEQW